MNSTSHARAAAARFALSLTESATPPTPPRITPPHPGEITLLTGPSGSGKSTTLAAIAKAAAPRPVRHLQRTRLRDIPAVDHFPKLTPYAAMRALASAGLADARAFLRTPSQLSEGQRWRLRLAVALHRLPQNALLIADEFAATLDPRTATAVARLLRKAATTHKLAIAAATSREDLTTALVPNTHTRFTLTGASHTTSPRPRPNPIRLRITEGTKADYLTLAPLHYLPGHPATIDHVLTARAGRELAAVLVASRPTLNAAHRALAWSDRYTTHNKSADAHRLNRELRCLSRVIVDPRFRGQGVARRLVTHYLKNPRTPCTEAIAAMGALCPFFARAGMTPYTLPPPQRSARLLDAFAHIDISREDLTDRARIKHRLRNKPRRAFIERELRTWAHASRATSRSANQSLNQLLSLAHARLTTERTAYAHTKD